MNEGIKILAMVLTPFLVVIALFYFTRRNRKLRFYLVMPVLLAVAVWVGFAHGWRTGDFVQLGILLFCGVAEWFSVFRTPTRK